MKRPFGRNQEPVIKPVRLAEEPAETNGAKPPVRPVPTGSSSIQRGFDIPHRTQEPAAPAPVPAPVEAAQPAPVEAPQPAPVEHETASEAEHGSSAVAVAVEDRPEHGEDDYAGDIPPAEPTQPAEAATPADDGGVPVISPTGNRFGELLVRKNLVNPNTLVDALLQQTQGGQRLGALLVELGALGERDLAAALSEHLNVPLADLRKHKPDADAIALLKDHEARELGAIPVRIRPDGVVEVAVADPTPDVRRVLEHTMRKSIEFLIAPASEITRLIEGAYRAVDAIEAQVKAFRATEAATKTQAKLHAAPTAVGGQTGGADAPVVQVVHMLIAQALRDRASDIHIEPQDDQVRARFRVDGALHDVINLPAGMGPAVASRIKIMANMNIVERRKPQDGQTSLSIDGRALDVRVSTTPTVFGEKIVMRLLDKSRPLFKAAELGMPTDTNETFAKLVHSPFGMVVCVGPTGSGKTTTLYATLGDLNTNERNIMTIEDPVEYVIPSINQIQINEQAGVTFADGLRSILRQDPDVILVGEIRDAETARIAVQSALTGHLVLSSLHATDTAAAIHRFLDMGIEAFLVASSVVGIVGQRLVRRICKSCAAPYQPTDEEMAFYREAGGTGKDAFWQGEGCNFCAGTGYSDRIGVYELLRVTPEVKRLIVGWATQEEIRRMAISQGMRTLLQEGLDLVEKDTTTISEVIRVIYAS